MLKFIDAWLFVYLYTSVVTDFSNTFRLSYVLYYYSYSKHWIEEICSRVVNCSISITDSHHIQVRIIAYSCFDYIVKFLKHVSMLKMIFQIQLELEEFAKPFFDIFHHVSGVSLSSSDSDQLWNWPTYDICNYTIRTYYITFHFIPAMYVCFIAKQLHMKNIPLKHQCDWTLTSIKFFSIGELAF